VHGEEVGRRHEVLECGHELDTELAGPFVADVRVVGGEAHAEGVAALGDHHADTAQADDAERLAVQLDALPSGTVPAAIAQVAVGLRDVAGLGEQERDRVLGRRQHIRLRCVDDHHAPARGCGDIHVVEADAGPSDHDEVGGGGEYVLRHRRGAAHDQRGRVVDRLEQLIGIEVETFIDVEARTLERLDPARCDLLGDEDTRRHCASPCQARSLAMR
jgi:hypothetical protein